MVKANYCRIACVIIRFSLEEARILYVFYFPVVDVELTSGDLYHSSRCLCAKRDTLASWFVEAGKLGHGGGGSGQESVFDDFGTVGDCAILANLNLLLPQP